MSRGFSKDSSRDRSLDLSGGAVIPNMVGILGSTELQFIGDSQIALPLDQRNKMNRVLSTMQRRLVQT